MQDEGEILKKERGIDMPVRVHNFLGRLGWNARKYFPVLFEASVCDEEKAAEELYRVFYECERGASSPGGESGND